MKKVLVWLDKHFEDVFLCVFLAGIVVFMTAHVFFRYVMRQPIVWTEELTRYLFIWFVFTGFSYGIKNGTHLRVNIIESFFPKTVPALNVIQDLVVLGFILCLCPYGFRVMDYFARTGQTSPGLKVPMLYIYASLMAGLLLSLFRMVQKWVLKFLAYRKKGEATL